MNSAIRLVYLALLSLLFAGGCAATKPQIPVNYQSIKPGGVVKRGNQQFKLLGFPLKVGDRLPDTILVNAARREDIRLSAFKGKVLLLSTVPSIDTKVCERQTHYLGEQGDRLPKDIVRITISRDTPFAQNRFAKEAKLTDITFLSDYRKGDFGLATGLLVDNIDLLTRAVLVADRSGTVRYMQIVPQLENLPDMEAAFKKAQELDRR